MTHLFLEREFETALRPADVVGIARDSSWCFELYGVDWHGSLLRLDGHRMLCRLSAADAESVRQALRRSGSQPGRLWPGTIHDAADSGTPNVLVEREFEEPVALGDIQAIEDAHQWCLDTRNVKFVRTYFSTDRKRMVCLYSGPDAESVREAQREAGLPLAGVWAFQQILPGRDVT
jgi:hypothetical protein